VENARSLATASVVLAAIAAGGFLLANSCTAPTDTHVSSAVVRHFSSGPSGVTWLGRPGPDNDPNPQTAWAGPGRVYVRTYGSSSCPSIPTSVDADDAHHLVVKTVVHDFYEQDDACTADLGPTTSVVEIPSEIDEHHPVLVEIDDVVIRLPARTD
jgi:hypothetical protein